MPLGYDKKLYILAFDHRGSFEKMVGGGHDKISSAKHLIWEGFQQAIEAGTPVETAGILGLNVAVLRKATLTDVQFGENFDSHHEVVVHPARNLQFFFQHAVDAIANTCERLRRLDVDVARVCCGCLIEDHFLNAHHRSTLRLCLPRRFAPDQNR